MFNPDEPMFAKGIICELPYPTDDTRLITKAASAGQELIYRAGFAFSKAEILLLDLRQRGEFTDDLFVATPPVAVERVMGGDGCDQCVLGTRNHTACRSTGKTGLGHAAGDEESELYDTDRSVIAGNLSA